MEEAEGFPVEQDAGCQEASGKIVQGDGEWETKRLEDGVESLSRWMRCSESKIASQPNASAQRNESGELQKLKKELEAPRSTKRS